MNLQWSWLTFIFYCFLGVYFYISSKHLITIRKQIKQIDYKKLFAFSFIPTFLSVYRGIEYPVGGTDAEAYIKLFNNSVSNTSTLLKENIFGLQEPAFMFLNRFTRSLTDDYHVLFWVIYIIIIVCLYYFISEIFCDCDVFIPLIYIVYYYLQSFNIIRFMLALAAVEVAFVTMSKKKPFLTITLLILAVLTHFTTLIIVPVFVLFVVYRNPYFRKSWWYIIGIVLVFGISYVLKTFAFGLLSDSLYLNYATSSRTSSILFHFTTVMCSMLSILFFNDFKEDKRFNWFMYFLVIFDLALIPVSIYLKFFRIHIIFTLPRLYMWSKIYQSVEKRVKQKNVIQISFALMIITWTIFRFVRDWEGAGLMPYYIKIG